MKVFTAVWYLVYDMGQEKNIEIKVQLEFLLRGLILMEK